MGRTTANPKKHIVSCRINNEEMETLRDLAEETGLSITMLLRKSLEILSQQNQFAEQLRA